MTHPARIPTLGQLAAHNDPDWWWIICPRCLHQTAVKLATLIARHGPDASTDVIRTRGRCSECGHRGAALQHPSWANSETGWEPFPGD